MQVMPNKMVRKGETIFQQGDGAADGMYYICYGKVLVTHTDAKGQRNMSELGEGDAFGEMALINADVRNATVSAQEDCGFFVISRDQFQEKVKILEPIMRGAFRTLVVTIRSLLEQRDRLDAERMRLRQELKVATNAAPGAVSDAGEDDDGLPEGRKLQF
jgi:CRP-like cAMP-binding protein